VANDKQHGWLRPLSGRATSLAQGALDLPPANEMTESAPPSYRLPPLDTRLNQSPHHLLHHSDSIRHSLVSSSPTSNSLAPTQSPVLLKHVPIKRPLSTILDSNSTKSTSPTTAHAEFHQSSVYSSFNRPSLSVSTSSQPRLRQLILPMLRTATTTVRSSSPGSPPDLTDSKSSKSSSFPSSSLADAAPADLSHFEDISLDDVAAVPNAWAEKAVPGSQIRSHPPVTSLYRNHPAANSGSLRDLTNGSRTISGGRPHSAGTSGRSKFQLPVPGPRSARPRMKQLVTNGHPMLADQQIRSPSASAMLGTRNFSPSTLSIGASSSSGRTRFSSSSIHVQRRQSWQPGRKSVQELEDEYHDSDEEVPDDAVIWNVPISPRPPHERELKRAETEPSPRSSSPTIKPQPEQSNTSADTPTLDRADTNMSSASAPPALNIDDIKRPLTPQSPGLSDTSSAEYPGHIHSMSKRDIALATLSREARELTDALEMFAEESERQQEERIQCGITKASSMPTSPTRTDLPPMRRNDPLIDPLPVSKEKEKFLTRTRPSWLPPKNLKEERRHLKEYQKIMARAVEAEKKRAHKQQKSLYEKDDAALERVKAWDNDVLPNWRTAVREPKTKDLWWKGIPPQRRGDVWSHAIGNELGLNTASYEAALKRAHEADSRLANMTEEDRERDPLGVIFAKLHASASCIYPDLSIFQPNGPLHQPLLDICKAYAVYRVDADATTLARIPSLAALLLLNLPAAPAAFITLANALNRPLPSALLASATSPTADLATLHTSYNLILTTLQHTVPSLHTHLLSLSHRTSASSTTSSKASDDDFDSSSTSSSSSTASTQPSWTSLLDAELLRPLLLSLVFPSPSLGVDIACRMWDVTVFEGDVALVRAAVAVLERLEGRLYGGRWEEVCRELGGAWDVDTGNSRSSVSGTEACWSGERVATITLWPLGQPDEFLGRMRKLDAQG
jgi:hypothetical protein